MTSASGGDRRAGLRDRLAIDPNVPGKNQRARAFARRRRARVRRAACRGESPFFNSCAADDPAGDGRQLAGEPGALSSAASARGRRTRPPGAATRRGRRAPGRSACRRRHPCRRSCRDPLDALDVQDVVDDLERESDLGARSDRRPPSARLGRAAHDRAGEQPTRGSARRSCACAFRAAPSPSSARAGSGRAQIERLPADHAGTHRRLRRRSPTRASLRAAQFVAATSGPRRLAREQRERFGQQRVAGEDRHAFAEDDVGRRPAPPQRVVVHRRQIVVHERIGVDHLERARRRHRERERRVRRPGRWRCGDRFGGRRARAAAAAACRRRAGCSASPRRRSAAARRPGRAGRNVSLERLLDRWRRARSTAARRVRVVAASPRFVALVDVGVERRRARASVSPRSLRISTRRSASSSLRVAEARQLHAALEELERLFEREVAVLELLDDRLELGDRRFKILDCRVGHFLISSAISCSAQLQLSSQRPVPVASAFSLSNSILPTIATPNPSPGALRELP